MIDDTELLRRYAETRSEAAFAEIVRRHLSLVYHAALRRTGGRVDLAQDAAQGVFMKTAREASTLCRRPAIAGWLYIAARFAAGDLLRAEHRRLQREREAQLLNTHTPVGGSLELSWEYVGPALEELLTRLSALDREIVLRRFFEAQSFEEIGTTLNLSDDAARKRSERALAKMRNLLAKRGINSSSAALTSLLVAQSGLAVPPLIEQGIVRNAIASAASSTAGSNPLHFNRITDFTQIVAGLVGVVGLLTVGVAVREVRAQHQAEAELAKVTESSRIAASRLREIERQFREQQMLITTPSTEPMPVSSANAGTTATPMARGQAFLEAHPEMQTLIEQQAKNHFAWKNGPRGRAIGLTADQIEKITDLETRESGQTLTFGQEPGFMQLNQSLGALSKEEVQEQIRTLMGEDARHRAFEYDRIDGARSLVTAAALVLNFTETPLTPAQTSGLMQIVAEASPGFRDGQSVVRSRLDWDAIIEHGKGLLSGPQIEVLKTIRTRQSAEEELARYEKSAASIAPKK